MSAAMLLDRALARGALIATAESCTCGLVAGAITEIPGSSEVFERGFVTYSNAAKTDLLGVPAEMIEAEGAVSEAVAGAMAKGALDRSHATLAVAITGVAGPGASERKPEGMVCFGLAQDNDVHVETLHFGAIGRGAVRAGSRTHTNIGIERTANHTATKTVVARTFSPVCGSRPNSGVSGRTNP